MQWFGASAGTSEITARRNVKFFAFTLVKADGAEFENSRMQQLSWLEKQGFEVVEHHLADRASIEEEVAWFSEQIVGTMISRLIGPGIGI